MAPAVTRAQPPAFPLQGRILERVVIFSPWIFLTQGLSPHLLHQPNLPLELRGKAGGCARVTAGAKRPHLGVLIFAASRGENFFFSFYPFGVERTHKKCIQGLSPASLTAVVHIWWLVIHNMHSIFPPEMSMLLSSSPCFL